MIRRHKNGQLSLCSGLQDGSSERQNGNAAIGDERHHGGASKQTPFRPLSRGNGVGMGFPRPVSALASRSDKGRTEGRCTCDITVLPAHVFDFHVRMMLFIRFFVLDVDGAH